MCEKIVRRAAPVVGLGDLDVRAAGLVLAHGELARQTEGVLSVVDVATFPRSRLCRRGCGGAFDERGGATRGQLAHMLKRGAGGAAFLCS